MTTNNDYDVKEEILKAVELLHSIGSVNLCHPTSHEYGDVVPLCHPPSDSTTTTTTTTTFLDAHATRQLLEGSAITSDVDKAIMFYIKNIAGALTVVGFVALISGLFLGLLTLDALNLQIIQRASVDEDERRYAAALYPIVKKRHLLLVTLLILNALAYEALPIFLDALVPSWVAILLSTTLVLIFGEIIPSAIFTGPNQLRLGYHMIPLVRVLIVLLYPLARPLANILDCIVFPDGEDDAEEAYNRGELSALVKIQYENRHSHATSRRQPPAVRKVDVVQTALHPTNNVNNNSNNNNTTSSVYGGRGHRRTWSSLKQEMLEAVTERLNDDDDHHHYRDEIPTEQLQPPLEKQEIDVVVGALGMKTKVVMDVYTPLRKVYAIPDDLILDRMGVTEIYAKGFSRVPVYHRSERHMEQDDHGDADPSLVRGYLMTRQLMMIDWDHEREVTTLPLVRPEAVSPRVNLVQTLKLLKAGGSLMAFVCARPDLANRALAAEKCVPIEAGFMGIITLEDIMESILQDRIYDEWDIRDRDRAVGTLNRWAANKLQQFARKKIKAKKNKRERAARLAEQLNSSVTSVTSADAEATDETPLLQQGTKPATYNDIADSV